MSDNDKQKVWVVVPYKGDIHGIYADYNKAQDAKEELEEINPALDIYVDEYEVIK